MFSDMSLQLFLLLAADGSLPTTPMNLRLQGSLVTLLTNELSHHRAAHRETHCQHGVASFLVAIRDDDPFPQIHR
jgi:hypothetical protein